MPESHIKRSGWQGGLRQVRIVDPKASGANGAWMYERIQFETAVDAVGVYFAKEPNRLEFGSLRP